MSKPKLVCTIDEEFPAQEVPEYQVLLTFLHDDDGVFFREWWPAEGCKAFAAWLATRKTEEQ